MKDQQVKVKKQSNIFLKKSNNVMKKIEKIWLKKLSQSFLSYQKINMEHQNIFMTTLNQDRLK